MHPRVMLSRRFVPVMAGVLLGLGGVVAGCSKNVNENATPAATPTPLWISLPEVRSLVQRNEPGAALLVDARGPAAFETGHIPGAKNFSISHFSGKHGETEPGLVEYDTIVVYADGPESASAEALALRMMNTGYENIQVFYEGLDAWKKNGMPVVGGEQGGPR